MKHCNSCNTTKPIEEFYTNYDNRNKKSYVRHICHSCDSKKSREYYLANKAKILENSKKNHLLRNYGLTQDQFNDMVKAQDGKCAICDIKPPRTLHVDHCHDTGKIRKLLCDGCNQGIGLFKEDVSRLSSAIKYLTDFSAV